MTSLRISDEGKVDVMSSSNNSSDDTFKSESDGKDKDDNNDKDH